MSDSDYLWLQANIMTGYLSMESSELAAYVAFALEAWIGDNLT